MRIHPFTAYHGNESKKRMLTLICWRITETGSCIIDHKTSNLLYENVLLLVLKSLTAFDVRAAHLYKTPMCHMSYSNGKVGRRYRPDCP